MRESTTKNRSLGVQKPKLKASSSERKTSSLLELDPTLPSEVKAQLDLTQASIPDVNFYWRSSQSSARKKLEYAADMGCNRLLKKIMDENNVNVNETNALFLACLAEHYETARILIEEYNANVNQSVGGESPPLFAAVERGNVYIVRFLLDKGADVNAKNNFSKETALHTCLRMLKYSDEKILNKMYISIMALLIQRGADITISDRFFCLPIPEAIKKFESSPELKQELDALFAQPDDVFVDELNELFARHHLDSKNDMVTLLAAFSALGINEQSAPSSSSLACKR